MTDYLIVGLGLAGIAFCETLEKHGKSFKVISNHSQMSSKVAGGLYNPVVLKRFTPAWKAEEQLSMVQSFYTTLEHRLDVKLHFKTSILRLFANAGEQNLWFEAADKPLLSAYMLPAIHSYENPGISAPYGYGKVRHTGRVDTNMLLEAYAAHLRAKNLLVEESFDFNSLTITKEHVAYRSLQAKQLVLAMGYGLKQDPYFNYLPLEGNKGELLKIHCPDLKEKNVIKSSVFIIPLGKDTYRIGATYSRDDKTNQPTEAAREQLLKKLDRILKYPYSVLEHEVGVRPTVADRRPLVGRHPELGRLYVLNGFGSRGVMIAPYAASQLFHHIEDSRPLEEVMDVTRFIKKYVRRTRQPGGRSV